MCKVNVEVTPTTYKQNGAEFSRITSVLATIPSPALNYWLHEKVAQGAILAKDRGLSNTQALHFAMEAPEEASRDAREQGTTAHEIIRAFNAGKAIALKDISDPVVRKKVNVWMDFRMENKFETLSAERTLFSERYKIAGTLDHYGYFNDMVGVDDFKTGGVYDKAFIQLSAYNEMLKENGITDHDIPLRVFQITEEEVIVHTPESFFKKKGRNSRQESHIPSHDELFAIFRCALLIYRFQILRAGKHEHLVKNFSDLAKDTSILISSLEAQWN